MERPEIKLPIGELANGGVQEKLDMELKKIFHNIADPNTEAKTARKVQITLEFKPDDERQRVDLKSSFKTTLAPVKDVSTLVLTEEMDGKVYAAELKSDVKGQTYFDADDSKLKTDTGEPIEEVEQEAKPKSDVVIGLQKKKGLFKC
ncbi:hypothetical protein JCM14202_3074 [Agrilactobacillus composti DSM 18527 = JCM 14202]|nr:hypothetical protein [Agrilactobacillus composti]GAF41149.1 hypothetical protein JCM14202_3074 [Agrilactobacillus composti DSM 18527 = JCM 14202]